MPTITPGADGVGHYAFEVSDADGDAVVFVDVRLTLVEGQPVDGPEANPSWFSYTIQSNQIDPQTGARQIEATLDVNVYKAPLGDHEFEVVVTDNKHQDQVAACPFSVVEATG